MSPLRLFTAFHANLDFSALPDADRPIVIARCYWPLLRLPEELGIPIGFELSARTLRTLLAEDPEWVKRFRGLAERGLVEPIASGWAQVVAPLAPVEVNRTNLELGRQGYEAMLGYGPETWYVHEQTFAEGLVPLYSEIGAHRVVMEWNNPASRRPELRRLRCRPARLASGDASGPVLLWNDSIVFQKIQRVAQGEIPFEELEALLARLAGGSDARSLCLYGGDVEIFDYRPSRRLPGGSAEARSAEADRLIGLFARLAADPRFEFVLPRSLVEPSDLAALPSVRLTSAADPIPCKKQPRYNPTRWAVTGRDGFGMNTRCHALLRSDLASRRLAPDGPSPHCAADLVDLWRSDFRTRATEEKVLEFETRIAIALERSRARLARVAPALGEGEQLVLANPDAAPWSRMPIEIPLRLAAGRFEALELRTRRGAPLAPSQVQIETEGLHRDGSLRDVVLVLAPELPPRDVLGLELVAAPRARADEAAPSPVHRISTDRVTASFLAHRGAALEELAFPAIDGRPLLGTIAHGSFDAIEYTPDFYSGHVVALLEDGGKRTDLRPTRLELRTAASGAIRATFVARFESDLGVWQKTYRVYRGHDRLDVVHELAHHDVRIASLRLGLFTLLPDGWDLETLRYGAVHGGRAIEWHGLGRDVVVAQSKAVSAGVSASSCLGATEGWVAIADARRGILIQSDRGRAAVAPMLDFEPVDDRFFCRLSHSAAEVDETRACFLRGHQRFAFTVEGYAASDAGVFDRARQRHQGLIYRTEAGVGVATGL
ncbi:MAG: hypothetical protein R3F35_00495 [Myxococcota bacterium]